MASYTVNDSIDRPRPTKRLCHDNDIISSNSFPTLTSSITTTPISSFVDTDRTSGNFTRFFVVNSPDKTDSLDSVSPFKIQKTFEGMVSNSLKISKLRSNDLLVECFSATQSKLIKNLKLIGNDVNITCKPHPTLNSSKGVIWSKDLVGYSNAEILEDLSDQNVSVVTRLILRKDGKETKTNTFFLTFDGPSIPNYIRIGYLSVPVRMYIPNPLRCFNCQRFGHGSRYCRSSQICGKCGGSNHKLEDCNNDPNCFNCKGNHIASSKDCPNWKREKEIIEIKTTKKISFPQARTIYESENKNNQNSNTTQNTPQTKTQNTSQFAQVINPDRTQNNPQTITQNTSQFAQVINPDRTPNINSVNINSDKTLNRDLDRTPYLNLDRVSGSNSNRTSNINSDRTLNMNPDRTPYLDLDRTPYLNLERTLNINSDRTQNILQSPSETTSDMGTQTDVNIEWLRETLIALNERDPSFLSSLLGGSGGYGSVKLKDKAPSQIDFSEEEKEIKKPIKKLSSCNSGPNGDGSDGCVLERGIVIEPIIDGPFLDKQTNKQIGNDTNVMREVIEKTNDDENVVIVNSSDVSNTSVISKTIVSNPNTDHLSPMDTSQNDSSIHEGKIEQTFINSGEPERFPSGENSRKNQSTI